MSEVDLNPGSIEPQSGESQAIVPAPPRNRVFIGANGLRAGWSLAIYCLIMAAVYAPFSTSPSTQFMLISVTASQSRRCP